MPTKWNPLWTETQKAAAREKRRRKYALKRLTGGKTYTKREAGKGVIDEPARPLALEEEFPNAMAEKTSIIRDFVYALEVPKLRTLAYILGINTHTQIGKEFVPIDSLDICEDVITKLNHINVLG